MRLAPLMGLLLLFAGAIAADSPAGARSTWGWIAFDERTYFPGGGGDAWEVFVMRPDGTDERMVTPKQPALDNMSAAWSPSGSRIAFTGQALTRHVSSGIYVVNADGTGWRLVARVSPQQNWPSTATWSPDARRIAFNRGGSIWTASSGGGDERRLTRSRTDHQPAWSPDGARIIFARGGALWIVRSGGGKAQPFATNGANPSWSPDGLTLAFENRIGRIVLIKRDGTHRHPLGWGQHPSWSPDGRMIVFDGGYGISVMDRDGRDASQVRRAETARPAWGR